MPLDETVIHNKIGILRERIASIKRWTRYEVQEDMIDDKPCVMGVEEDDHSIHSFCIAKEGLYGRRSDIEYMAAADPDTISMLLDYILVLEQSLIS